MRKLLLTQLVLQSIVAVLIFSADGENPPVNISANRIDTRLVIDGSFGEAVWKNAEWKSCFRQSIPHYNQRATERTEVAFLFDTDHIYIGVRCLDSEPDQIVATKLRHRDDIRHDDVVQVIFDTYRDQLRGSVFVVNPLGAKEEGQVNGFRRYNWDWDDVWEVATSLTSDGWQAEFRIPLRVLRFSGKEEQVWGVNVCRVIRRKREHVYLAPPSPPYDISSLNFAARLSGIQNVQPERNLQFKPYFLAGTGYDREDGAQSLLRDIGMDIKYSLTSDLTLDLTFNTDFAQVESDTEQVNLSRFSLFFPEKRDFFLENAQLFTFGAGGGWRRELDAFFSRRIGIHEEDTVPINVGVRLTGKVGRQDVGILSVRTGAVEGLGLDEGLYNVVRIKRNLAGRSYVGGIFTDSRLGDFRSSTYGIDGDYYLTRDLSLSALLVTVDSPEIENSHTSWQTQLDYTTTPWGARFTHMEVGDNFEPDLGFVRRSGFRRDNLTLRRDFRPDRWGVRKISFMGWNSWYHTMEGALESLNSMGRLELDFESGENLQIRVTNNFERLFEPFELSDDLVFPRGDYRFLNSHFEFRTEGSRRWHATASVDLGGYYDGRRRNLRGSLRYIFTNHLSVWTELATYQINSIHGEIDWRLWRGRINYTHNAYLSVSAFLQYNSSTGDATANLRLRWIHSNDSDFFVVFNERRVHELDRWLLQGRDAIVKLNYRFFF